MFADLKSAHDDLRSVKGLQTASVLRLLPSDSPGVGIPPTENYASGLTDLPVIARLGADGLSCSDTASEGKQTAEFEFWNVQVFLGDQVLFDGERYEVSQVTSTERVVLAEVFVGSGVVQLSASEAREQPVEAMCLVCVKPASEVSIRLRYVAADDEEVVSDEIVFGADCKVGDLAVLMNQSVTCAVKRISSLDSSNSKGSISSSSTV